MASWLIFVTGCLSEQVKMPQIVLSNSHRLMFSASCFKFLIKSNDLSPIDSVPPGPLSRLVTVTES